MPSNPLITWPTAASIFFLSAGASLGHIINNVPHAVGIVLQSCPSLSPLSVFFIFSLEYLCFPDHSINLLTGQSRLVIGDGDLATGTSCLFFSRNIQDTVASISKQTLSSATPLGAAGIP
ncbi:hypothetical protein I3760_01G282800 [Carya illinoinensis]|uniref:Uncharacterized protein n=1 Tax=Carya illinoinensis TaxID=32201 RepID=A0A8T1RSV3_CARIL|nr:hypothetical protein I3760_01G282800 [Carya illinoinensis]KAG6670074.1 hypothetical protein CIPAW_01G285700 [Carya illinoinensis]